MKLKNTNKNNKINNQKQNKMNQLTITQQEFNSLIEFSQSFLSLNETTMKELSITKENENTLLYHNFLLSRNLKESIIKHHIVLSSRTKIVHFETLLFSVLNIISEHSLPSYHIDNFFIDEITRNSNIFGTITYIPFDTQNCSICFNSEINSNLSFQINHSVNNKIVENKNHSNEIYQIIQLMKEIEQIVGISETYNLFHQFIEDLENDTIQKIQQIKDHSFYKLCYNRNNENKIDENLIKIPIKQNAMKTSFVSFDEESIKTYNIGKGGYATVIKVHCGYFCALKIPHIKIPNNDQEKNENEQFMNEFLRECHMTQILYDQPNILSIRGIITRKVEKKKQSFIRKELLMTYYPSNLSDHINNVSDKQHPLFLDKTKQSLILITDILSCALSIAQIGINHRDYKPGNILMSKEKRVFICDFGSSFIQSPGKSYPLVGYSPAYIPDDYSSVNDKTANDIYALAIIIADFLSKKSVSQYVEILANRFKEDNIEANINLSNSVLKELLDDIHSVKKNFELDISQLTQWKDESKDTTRERKLDIYSKIIEYVEHLSQRTCDKRAHWIDVYELREQCINYLKELNYDYKLVYNHQHSYLNQNIENDY